MGEKPAKASEMGLQFFGKISASISHELKNVMAIINENAGLLEDLTLMADRGKPLDPARLKIMAATVHGQIGRADEILKKMNRFAHSIDETVAQVNLHPTIELFMALTDRFASMRGIERDLQMPADPLTIRTAPFYLLNLLMLCLDFCMSTSPDTKRLELIVTETDNSVRIHFRQPGGFTRQQLEDFPSRSEKELLTILAAELTAEPGDREIVLRLPKKTE